jgi:hypothetical protein
MMNNVSQPTNATQAKDRLYAQLATRFTRLSRAISQTADLCEHLQIDLHAMRMFAGLHASTCVLAPHALLLGWVLMEV